MFYDARGNKQGGLPHDPFKALVAPRPIGWISTLDAEGRPNLAPYSFFNAVSSRPNIVVFSSGRYKDSVANVDATREFVCVLSTWDLREAMNTTSAEVPRGVDEIRLAGLTPVASNIVKPPRIAESPVALECVHLQTMELNDMDGNSARHWLVFGQVVGVHIDDAAIVDGLVDVTRLKPIARLGYSDYSVVTEIFSMRRPEPEEVMAEDEGLR